MCKVHLLGIGTFGQILLLIESPFVNACVFSGQFFAEVVNSLLHYVMVYSVYPRRLFV